MKPFATTRTVWLTICFTSVSLLLSMGGSLFAQERKGENALEALRKPEEALKKQIEELNRQLDEMKKMRTMLYVTPGEVQPPAEPATIGAMRVSVATPGGVSEPVAPPIRRVSPLGPGVPGKKGIQLKKQELEKVMRSHGDAGLVTLLRFEKAKVCRKARMYHEAVEELQKIIEENLADETTIAARWTLVEILQEQKKNEEAMAELEKIFILASDTQDRTDAIYGIINLSGEGPKARIQAIDRLVQALLRNKANWDGCTRNLEQLYAAQRKYAEDHHGYLSEKLSDLYPDYVNNLDVFTCPAAKGPKIITKEDIDSLTSYLLVAKGKPANDEAIAEEGPVGYAVSTSLYCGRSEHKVWIREKEQNHGRRWLAVYSDGLTGWFAR